jgi:hypothetical protein
MPTDVAMRVFVSITAMLYGVFLRKPVVLIINRCEIIKWRVSRLHGSYMMKEAIE